MNNQKETKKYSQDTQPSEKPPLHQLEDYDDFLATHPHITNIIYEHKGTEMTRAMRYKKPGDAQYALDAKRSKIAGYLGSGADKASYALDDRYVVKILANEPLTYETPIEEQVGALQEGIGIAGLEQLVTANLEQEVIITKLAPGKPLATIPSFELLSGIKRSHIEKLRETLAEMTKHDLEYDNVGNVLFDPEEGFTIIDYRQVILTPDTSSVTRYDDKGNAIVMTPREDYLRTHSPEIFLENLLALKQKKGHPGLLNSISERTTYFTRRKTSRILARSAIKKLRR